VQVTAKALAGLGETAARALGAIVGGMVGDAAAQPSHWNYAQKVFQQQLKVGAAAAAWRRRAGQPPRRPLRHTLVPRRAAA
jgi:hypothetical protein